MRVVWVNDYAFWAGGAEHSLFDMAKLLNESGVESFFLYRCQENVDPQFLEPFEGAFPLWAPEEQLAALQPDVVIVHNLEEGALAERIATAPCKTARFLHDFSLLCVRKSKLPLFSNTACTEVAGCRCYPLGFTIAQGKIRTLAALRRAQKQNRRFGTFFVASDYMLDLAIASGFSLQRVKKLPLFAPPNRYIEMLPEKDPRVVLFAGSLVRGKGVDTLVEAAALVKSPVDVYIAGAGKPIKTHSPNVHFLGLLDTMSLSFWFAKAGLFAFPVRWPEPFGLVGLEAMQVGTPVIAPLIGGTPEWHVPGKTGVAIPPNDPKALATAIDTLYSDTKTREAMSAECIKCFEKNWTGKKTKEAFLAYVQAEKQERYTVRGSKKLEGEIQKLLDRVAWTVYQKVPASELQALVLLGSYGRGEGGIEIIEGEERPHNDLDVMLITKNKGNWQEKIAPLLDPLIDFSVRVASKVQKRKNTLMTYEMMHGHKVLLGDVDFVKNLPCCSLSDVAQDEFIFLLLNRYTLFLINEWLLLKHKNLSPALSKILLRHAMKATQGVGDALLYFLGDYKPSYSQRRRCMEKHPEVGFSFCSLYETASAFREEPSYNKQDFSQQPLVKATVEKWIPELKLSFFSRKKGIVKEFQKVAFGAPAKDRFTELSRYLDHWASCFDPNFRSSVKRWEENA